MYLKQIKAYGFKSFADKIEIELKPNINGIVGPNGSGKSNIVDAVRWVLGEQSVKSLRGENSTDIIFSGSKSRKALNSAYVTLIFDNSDHTLPIDYEEVAIKRVLYRTGENEYFLNNERCRLKDINDILVDSGAAKESFNIISQGKIDEILSTKPGERRVIFEEAAGVLKYKKRKEEALRKLDRTNDNLERINDIVLELEGNLEPLKKQSQEASIYLETKEKLKEVEVALIVYDVDLLSRSIKHNKEKIEVINDEVIKFRGNQTNYDVEIIKSKNRQKEVELFLNEKQNNLLKVTQEIEKTDADIRILKERTKYQQNTDRINDNLIKLRESQLKIKNEIDVLNNEIELGRKKISYLDNYLESLNLKKKENNGFYSSLNEKYDDFQREITNVSYKITYLENAISDQNTLPSAVKNIVNNPRFTRVHDVIGNLLEVPQEYSLAISTALGGASNYLVVDTPDDAKELVNYLKNNNLGRATFYPLSVIRERNIDLGSLAILNNQQDFIGVADQLVTCNPMYKKVISNQLGNVIVTKSIASANLLSSLVNHKYKVVTLDGQVVNVGGSITGGSQITGTNIVREKHELETFKNKRIELDEKIKGIDKEIKELSTSNLELDNIIIQEKSNRIELSDGIKNKEKKMNDLQLELSKVERELHDLEMILGDQSNNEENKLLDKFYILKGEKENILKEIDILKLEKSKLETSIVELEEINKRENYYISKREKELKDLEVETGKSDIRLDNLLLTLNEEYSMTFDAAKDKYKLEMSIDLAREMVRDFKSKLKGITNVNIGSIEEYKRVKTRYDFLMGQKDDLLKAEDTLLEIIQEMDDIMKDKFLTTFEMIRTEFKIVFKELFRGGEAELVLTDPDNLLETGIEIQAVPSGKSLKSISLLSGGEKTFTAISLLFAILNVRPVPFCLLDEVEAALDEANVDAFGNYLYKYRDKTQFILITHKKKTMEFADVLYGITMQESGVSKLVSVRLEEISK